MDGPQMPKESMLELFFCWAELLLGYQAVHRKGLLGRKAWTVIADFLLVVLQVLKYVVCEEKHNVVVTDKCQVQTKP